MHSHPYARLTQNGRLRLVIQLLWRIDGVVAAVPQQLQHAVELRHQRLHKVGTIDCPVLQHSSQPIR